MSEFKEKRKGLPFQERPYLYLAMGILIGIIVAAIAFVSFFMIAGSETTVSEVMREPTVVPPLYPTVTAAVPPGAIQDVQATVVANRIQSAKISPNGDWIAVISVENGISTILLNQFQPEISLQAPLYSETGYFNDIKFSPDGRYLIATTEQYTGPSAALLFDTGTREIVERFPEIHAAAFSPDSSQLALASASTGLRIIDTATRNLVSSLQFDADAVYAMDYSSKNQIAIAFDAKVQLFNAQNLSAPPMIIPLDSVVYALAFHPDGEHLAIAREGSVQVVNLVDESRSYFSFDARQIFALAFSKDGEQLAIGGGDSGTGEARLIVFRWDTSDVILPDPNAYTPIALTGHRHVVTDVMFTPDGNLLSASWDGTVRLWSLKTHSEISEMQY